MFKGDISFEDRSDNINLSATLESGQTFLWDRVEGEIFSDDTYDGWYSIALEGKHTPTNTSEVVLVRQKEKDQLEWKSTTEKADIILYRLLRLGDNLNAIQGKIPVDDLIQKAFSEKSGLRVVRDPVFPCLISFICSSQMRIERIHGMQSEIKKEFGQEIEFDGNAYYTYPTPEQLSKATEEDLKDIGLGYRASYVERTTEKVVHGKDPRQFNGLEYEDARNALQEFVGVGDKVADCVLLFSMGYLEAVPLDTWINSAIDKHYPSCSASSYEKTSKNIREQFGGELAGYAQTYIFSYLREGD